MNLDCAHCANFVRVLTADARTVFAFPDGRVYSPKKRCWCCTSFQLIIESADFVFYEYTPRPIPTRSAAGEKKDKKKKKGKKLNPHASVFTPSSVREANRKLADKATLQWSAILRRWRTAVDRWRALVRTRRAQRERRRRKKARQKKRSKQRKKEEEEKRAQTTSKSVAAMTLLPRHVDMQILNLRGARYFGVIASFLTTKFEADVLDTQVCFSKKKQILANAARQLRKLIDTRTGATDQRSAQLWHREMLRHSKKEASRIIAAVRIALTTVKCPGRQFLHMGTIVQLALNVLESISKQQGQLDRLINLMDRPREEVVKHIRDMVLMLPYEDGSPRFNRIPKRTLEIWYEGGHDLVPAQMLGMKQVHVALFEWYNMDDDKRPDMFEMLRSQTIRLVDSAKINGQDVLVVPVDTGIELLKKIRDEKKEKEAKTCATAASPPSEETCMPSEPSGTAVAKRILSSLEELLGRERT